MLKKALLFLTALWIFSSCQTYYQKMKEFNTQFENAEFEAAKKTLDAKDQEAYKKNKLLHFLNLGTVDFMLSNHKQSNDHFEQAYRIGEDYKKTPLKEQAAALFTNPKVKTYTGEDHEILLINYFKALNYLYTGDLQAALVECRRMRIKLDELNDKYNNDNRYQRDALINLLMGLIYDADDDYNNAFIAYRNAYEIYKEDYGELFGTEVPEQLKKDILRTAYLGGLQYELEQYEKTFDRNYRHQTHQGKGDLVFLWHNGLGPVKDQLSLNFYLVKGQGGGVVFENKEYGWSFPFPDYNRKNGEGSNLGDINVVRVALPRYMERPPVYKNAHLATKTQESTLEMAENINKIAFRSLKDRLHRELGNALIRLALKKAAEKAMREENESIGALMGILNAITEQADTRNWQTLPHSIYYTRMKLPEGNHQVNLVAQTVEGKEQTFELNYDINAGRTRFDHFHTLGIRSPQHFRHQQW